jgi:hypothetical protein
MYIKISKMFIIYLKKAICMMFRNNELPDLDQTSCQVLQNRSDAL